MVARQEVARVAVVAVAEVVRVAVEQVEKDMVGIAVVAAAEGAHRRVREVAAKVAVAWVAGAQVEVTMEEVDSEVVVQGGAEKVVAAEAAETTED